MRVKIDKTGSNDQPAGVENFRVLRRDDFPRGRHLFYLLRVHKNIERRVGLRCRVQHAPVLNQKHWRIPWVSFQAPDVHRFL